MSSMPDATISIDLAKSCDVTKFSPEQLLQQEAFVRFGILLENAINSIDTNEKSRRVHNAIFIGGSRGSGKTTFMLNAEYISNDHLKDCLFLDLIDPTLLHNNEKFLSIILGLLANYVDKNQNGANFCNSNDFKANILQDFYKSLQKAATALDTIESDKCSGIDAMIANQNGLQLEENLNDIFSLLLKIYGKKLIVIRIDDIDMSFHHGYEILETVRKYLSSQYVLPIICGEMKQYRLIVERQFAENGQYPMFNKNGDDSELHDHAIPVAPDKKFAKRYKFLLEHRSLPQSITDGRVAYSNYAEHIVELAEKYLTKLFPKHLQINLISDVLGLLRNNGYAIITISNDEIRIPFEKLFDLDTRLRHYKIHRNYDPNHSLPNNPRELFQYLNSQLNFYKEVMSRIGAKSICNKAKNDTISDVKAVWKSTDCLSTLENNCNDLSIFLGIYRLFLTNLVQFTKYDISNEQLHMECLANLKAIVSQESALIFKYSTFFIDNMLDNDYGFLTPYANPYFKINPEYAMSFNRKTKIWKGISITSTLKKEEKDPTQLNRLGEFFFYMISEDNYYTTKEVACMPYSGRLITHIINSITPYHDPKALGINNDSEKTNAKQLKTNELIWKYNYISDHLSEITRRPYLCELSRTKVDGMLDELYFSKGNTYTFGNKAQFILDELSYASSHTIFATNNNNSNPNNTLNNYLIQCNDFGRQALNCMMLFPAGFLHKVLNHYFSNQIVFRKKIANEQDSVYTYIQRSLLMFLNAFAVFLNPASTVVEQNIAISDKFNLTETMERDRAYISNIYPLLKPIEARNTQTGIINVMTPNNQNLFMELCKHPIFHIFLPEFSDVLLTLNMKFDDLYIDENAIKEKYRITSEQKEIIRNQQEKLRHKRDRETTIHNQKYNQFREEVNILSTLMLSVFTDQEEYDDDDKSKYFMKKFIEFLEASTEKNKRIVKKNLV